LSLPIKSVFTPQYDRLRALLIDARKSESLTQAELAKQIGRPQSFVSKYERGERRLDVVEFLEITNALGIEASEIIEDIAQSSKSARTRAQSRTC
jgi:transcriptional regulator with XRE-family HTH domain